MIPSVAVVIPCYRVKRHVLGVIQGLPAWVDFILVVDDACPEGSGRHVQENCRDPRVHVLQHAANGGVGRATITGYEEAVRLGAVIVVKMDGDGQMDPAYLPRLIHPISSGRADFTKGNRFYDLKALRSMPLLRRIGNLGLSFLTKAASGYWGIADPTNGYTAVHAKALGLLQLEGLSRRYFFESSMLIQLNIVRASVFDVPIPARYGDEVSSLSLWRAFFGFPIRLVQGFFRRLLWRYFIYDVTAVTLLLLVGSVLLLFGVSFGSYHWFLGQRSGQFQSAGTVALALLPSLLGSQLLLQAILLDVMDRPHTPVHMLINDTRSEENPSCQSSH
jgi:glycosyltransferase involved in cell wall biosynthesis